MIRASSQYRHAVVIGGGLLGLEAANGLMKRGMDVTVVHIGPWLMERQLDEPAARLLQKSLEEKGMKFLLQKHTAELVRGESGRVAAIKFKPDLSGVEGDGDEIPADLVVMAVGIRPNTELAESAGLHCNRGIVVTDTLQTVTDPRIYSIGECAAHRGVAYGLVEQILAVTAGGDYSAAPKTKSMCGCTDHTHEAVREAIRENKLLTIPQVMQFMEWRTPNGCASCRPALNYYLISTWPGEAEDDPQSRFINERAHANIQRDGSYSVIPRMWGGQTTPAELRRIADVAEKYAIPSVKVTGGQRIDLLGVKKEDLPKVWADLDMPSGHAYGKALRTVKTCVGSEWCRFGTQDSTQMGIDLEKVFFKMWAPHKVKLAVSGCPRNCAEVAIKDVGIIGVDSGWEIYVAGNGGIKTEVAQFLVKVKTADEVLEYSGAFLQLYREEARYLDRTVHYVERVGLDYVKKKILDDADNRRALYERLLFALSVERDPWVERAREGKLKHEFETVAA
jgi:nitrite reductase (NADH) large subunit